MINNLLTPTWERHKLFQQMLGTHINHLLNQCSLCRVSGYIFVEVIHQKEMPRQRLHINHKYVAADAAQMG